MQGTFLSLSISYETNPSEEKNNSPFGYLVDRGSEVTINCEIGSKTKPVVVWDHSTIVGVNKIAEVNASIISVNLWSQSIRIAGFADNDCGTYICEAIAGNKKLQRMVTITVKGICTNTCDQLLSNRE